MTEKVVDNLGDIVRARRKELGLTQEDVAYKVGIEQTELSKLERGVRRPTPALARGLMLALDMSEGSVFA